MELREYLDACAGTWRKPILDPKSFGIIKYTTPITPLQYLEFAEKDLRLGGSRGLVNALTNAKRAIDCEISTLLACLGLPEPRNFPERLDRIRDLGLVAPRVVRKVVQLRNVLEHRYYKPSRVEVEDAVDVATLFLGALKLYHKGCAYLENVWLADESSANPRGEVKRTSTHTIWRHDSEPKYTYSRGIFVASELDSHVVELDLIHDNIEVGRIEVCVGTPGYVELQGLLLRADVDNIAYSRAGPRAFLKALRCAAP
ncbi:hypothetical protein [Piscinibacter sp.]|uniref:hypothetical protein n=1 Tax=Piscinibacter sp. TaxID=1903157 RepID=UPI0039E65C60